jgi:hypothetical protein
MLKSYLFRACVFALFLTAFCLHLHAQVIDRKGEFQIGGSANFYRDLPVNGPDKTVFDFTPQFGYFFTNRFVLGGAVTFQSNFLPGQSNVNMLAGPFIYYYFYKYFFIQPEYQIGFVSNTSEETSNTNTQSWIQLGLGYSIYIRKNLSVEPKLFTKWNYQAGVYTQNETGIEIGINHLF